MITTPRVVWPERIWNGLPACQLPKSQDTVSRPLNTTSMNTSCRGRKVLGGYAQEELFSRDGISWQSKLVRIDHEVRQEGRFKHKHEKIKSFASLILRARVHTRRSSRLIEAFHHPFKSHQESKYPEGINENITPLTPQTIPESTEQEIRCNTMRS